MHHINDAIIADWLNLYDDAIGSGGTLICTECDRIIAGDVDEYEYLCLSCYSTNALTNLKQS
jgi:hypothetical protein